MPARRLDLQQASHTLIAYSAACWAFVFGVFHIAWAAGWYIGLDPQWARTAFAKPWMLVYDVVVVGMCMVAVPVALALGMPWGRRLPRGILSILAWTGTCLLVLRAVASLVHVALALVKGEFVLRQVGIWEPWFYVGAALFGLNLWWYWRRPKTNAA